MATKYWLIGILLILTATFTACSINWSEFIGTSGCGYMSGAAKDNCYLESLTCSKIQSERTRDSCVVELAKSKGELKVCNLIATSSIRAYCQEQIAEIQNNHTICSSIQDRYWKDNCNFNLAVTNSKDTYCLLIGNVEQQQNCFKDIALATNNTVICQFLDEKEKGICQYQIAVNVKDIGICQELSEPLSRDTCRLKVAKLSNDKEKCDLIGAKSIKVICEDYFIASK